MVVDKLGNMFNRVVIDGFDGSARVALFMDFRECAEGTSLDERYLNWSHSRSDRFCVNRSMYSLTRVCSLLVRSEDCFL